MSATGKRVQGPLSENELYRLDAYWRAANYLSVGQIYLLDNPLLRSPLTLEHVKLRLLGHWGTAPGLIAVCVICDGEAATGSLTTALHSNKFLDPVGDGALPQPLRGLDAPVRRPEQSRADTSAEP